MCLRSQPPPVRLCLCVSRCVAVCRRGVLAGVFGDGPLRLELELLLIRGVEHFDLRLFWQRIYVPLLLPLCDVVLVPFCLARLAGAALDVFEPEPLPDDHPFHRTPKLFLTPHVAGLTEDSARRMSVQSAEEAMRILQGERPTSLVNPEVWEDHLRRLQRSP